ncbi:MAG: hypothetical protein ACO1N5_03670 [Noviherbaspirillum sp.]
MGFDQKGTVVICVSRGESGRWDVSENEFEDPLASFDDKQDACDYANKLTMTKQGASMVVLNAGGPSPMQARDSLRP